MPWNLATKGLFFSDEVYIVLNRTDIQSTKVPERVRMLCNLKQRMENKVLLDFDAVSDINSFWRGTP